MEIIRGVKKELLENGKIFVLTGKIPEGVTLDEIVAAIIRNGKEIGQDGPEGYIGGGTGGHIQDEPGVKTGSGAGGNIPNEPKGHIKGPKKPVVGGTTKGGSAVPPGSVPQGGVTEKTPREKDDDEKGLLPLVIGKAKKIGTRAIIAGALLAAVAGLSVTTKDTVKQESDNQAVSEVSNIMVYTIGDKDFTIPTSVIKNPGILIKHQRAEYIAENNGTYDGVNEYLENSTEESRIAEEEEIEEITREFDEQQRLMIDAMRTLQQKDALDGVKKNCIETIREAKREQIQIYKRAYSLFKKYNQKSKDAFNKDGGDDRSEFETDVANAEQSEYMISMSNLESDYASLSGALDVINNPDVLYDVPLPEAGTKVENYVINTEIFGKPVKIWKKSDDVYISLTNDLNIQTQKGHLSGDNVVLIDGEQLGGLWTTSYNIFALQELLKRLIDEGVIDKIALYGINLYENKDTEEPNIDI